MEFSDVTSERERELEELKNKIDTAFDNRKPENFIPITPNTNSSKQDLQQAQEIRIRIKDQQKKAKTERPTDNDPSVDLFYSPAENEVVTKNAHQYPSLLRLAINKALKFCGVTMNEDEQIKLASDNSGHEFEHHAQGIGEDGLEISYGVRFKEDQSKNQISWQPFIGLNGKAKSSTYEKIIKGPVKKSAGDEEMLK